MDERSRITVEDERDWVVSLLRTIADRLHGLNPPEARQSLARLSSPLALLAREAEALVGPLPGQWSPEPYGDATPDPPRQTVVFVHRGAALEA